MQKNTLQSPGKTSRFLLQSILWIALFCFATIAVLLIFFNNLSYPLKEKYYMPHLSYVSFGFLLLPVSLFIGACIWYFHKYRQDTLVL